MFKDSLFKSIFTGLLLISSACVNNNEKRDDFALSASTIEVQMVTPAFSIDIDPTVEIFTAEELDFKLSYFERVENAQNVWIYDYATGEDRPVYTFNYDEALPFEQIIWSDDGNKLLIPSFGPNGIELHTISLLDSQVSKLFIGLEELELFRSGEFLRDLKFIDWSVDGLFIALEVQKGFVEDQHKEELIVVVLNLSNGSIESLGSGVFFLRWSEKEPAQFAYLYRPEKRDDGDVEDLILMIKDVENDEILFESQIVENLSITGPRPFSAWDEENNIIVFDTYFVLIDDNDVRGARDGLMFFDINNTGGDGGFVNLPYQPRNWNANYEWISFERGIFANGSSLEPVIIEYKDDLPLSLGWINQSDQFLILENDVDVIVVNPNDPMFRMELDTLSLEGVSEFTQFFSWVR